MGRCFKQRECFREESSHLCQTLMKVKSDWLLWPLHLVRGRLLEKERERLPKTLTREMSAGGRDRNQTGVH